MAQLIPLTTDARQTFRTILGDQSVRVTAWWQPLDEHWYVSIVRTDGSRVIDGARLVEGGRPLRGQVPDVPWEGELYVEGIGSPGRRAWAETHRLLYLTPAELNG